MAGFTPERLRLARERRALTQKDLAERIGISQRALTNLESGVSAPSESTLAALVEALEFPPAFFAGPPLPRLSQEGASFRSLARMTASQRDAALAAGELAIELDRWIEDRFTRPTMDVPDLRGLKPEAAATALRTRWKIPVNKPISNMVHLLEAHGVRVYSLAEDAVEVDGFSVWHRDTPFVFLNTLKSGERGRMDAAHELGHLVLHRHGPPQGKEIEEQANRFASSFLMPSEGVLFSVHHTPTVQDLLEMRRYWRVSVAAMAYRAHVVGLLSEWHYREAMVEISKRGWRTEEPDGIPREQSQVLQKVLVAMHDENIKRSDVARALFLRTRDLDAMMFGLVPTASRGVPQEDPPKPPPFTRQLRLIKD